MKIWDAGGLGVVTGRRSGVEDGDEEFGGVGEGDGRGARGGFVGADGEGAGLGVG